MQALYGLPEMALLDMGDFAGGTLKYLRRHPVPRLSLAGGFAKLAKLAQGQLDLHSSRSSLDQAELARFAAAHGAAPLLVGEILAANTAGQILGQGAGRPDSRWPISWRRGRSRSAARCWDAAVAVEVLVVDRQGCVVGRAAGW